tara:strand:+ start:53 stop:835 length:783 start_codon:yes stop_codon:yes gene_type:complete
VKLYNEDCINTIKSLSSSSVDLVITSPPYNIGKKYNIYQDSRDDYVDWMSKIFNGCCKILKNTGHLFINIMSSKENPFIPYDIAKNINWKLQNNIIWAKSVEIDNRVRGYSTPTQSERYVYNGWEHIFHFTHNGETKIDREWSGIPCDDNYNNAKRHFEKTGRLWRPTTNCWHFTYKSKATKKITKQIAGDKKHPAIFPTQLVEKCIKLSGIKKGIVYDPFMGTGTTGLVCKQMGLDFIGSEIDKDYFDFAKQKIQGILV